MDAENYGRSNGREESILQCSWDEIEISDIDIGSTVVQRPLDIDDASWALICQMQMAGAVVSGRERGGDRRNEGRSSTEHEDASFALAIQLREEEDFTTRQQLRGQEDRSSIMLIEKLQQEENEVQSKERKSLALAQAVQAEEQMLARDYKPTTRLTKEEVWSSLQLCQKKAIGHVQYRAQAFHNAYLPQVVQRIRAMGYDQESVTRLLDYLREDAPIVIHLKRETLALLKEDTHYRNFFETSKSGGASNRDRRIAWETNLFGSLSYNSQSAPFDRPKYGCLNVTGDLTGVQPAKCYGDLVVTLAPHVRYRTTFSEKDSSSPDVSVATHDLYAHVVHKYSDDELRAVLNVSRIGGGRSRCHMYKEVQIHGPVCLATDIQALSVPGRRSEADETLRADVDEFQNVTKCNILWQGDLFE